MVGMAKKHFNCPAELTLEQISGKWKVIVLWLLRKGAQRSGRIKSAMPGISSTAFSKAVRELEFSGLIKRSIKRLDPLEVSYNLTVKGESMKPIVRQLVKWGLEYKADHLSGEFTMVSEAR